MKQKIRLLQRRTVHYLLAMTYWLTKRLPIQPKKSSLRRIVPIVLSITFVPSTMNSNDAT